MGDSLLCLLWDISVHAFLMIIISVFLLTLYLRRNAYSISPFDRLAVRFEESPVIICYLILYVYRFVQSLCCTLDFKYLCIKSKAFLLLKTSKLQVLLYNENLAHLRLLKYINSDTGLVRFTTL